jgi:hypothetical protein
MESYSNSYAEWHMKNMKTAPLIMPSLAQLDIY